MIIKMLKKLLFLLLLILFSCSQKHNQVSSQKENFSGDCKNLSLYQFKDDFIDLEMMKKVVIDRLPAEHFKVCSSYSHRFSGSFKNTLVIQSKTFTITNNKKAEDYKLNIFENQELIKSIQLPVEKPLPEVHQYSFLLLEYNNLVIVLIEDTYSTHFKIIKYDIEGNELMQTDIEHTYITHPEPDVNHYNPYLNYYGITKSEMIFSSHHFYAEKSKTVFLNLDNFQTRAYDQTTNGLILDEKEEEAIGFITYEEESNGKNSDYKITMFDGKKYQFSLLYGDEFCNLLLKDNLLYIANYHPIATGSSLHCFDMEKGEIKWTAEVLQINTSHSKYYNSVTLSLYKDKLIMEGNEAHGDYVQIFDLQTGERLADFGPFLDIDIE